jgi:hypothetical protein
MIRALLDYVGSRVSAEGAWWILGLNAILLIPLIFSVFFYPREVLLSLGAVVVLTVAAMVVNRAVQTRLHRHA